MLTSAYPRLKNGTPYEDLGEMHFTNRDRVKTAHRLVRRLQDIGYTVDIRTAA